MDEDARRQSIEKLAGWGASDAFNCTWHTLVDEDLDPLAILATRRRMKLELARYGKLGRPGEGLGWDGVEAAEIRRLHSTLGEILREEGKGAGLED